MSHPLNSVTRRLLIARSLGLSASAVSVWLAGEHLPAAAEKKQKKKYTKVQIAQRAQNEADMCAEMGGIAETSSKPGGVTVTCTQSDGSGQTCTYHSKGVRCSSFAINPGSLPDLHPQNPWATPGEVPVVPLEPTLRSGSAGRRDRGKQ